MTPKPVILTLDAARERLSAARRVAALTGAGISAESGIPTFRTPASDSGLWARFRPEDLASPEAYWRDPERVWAWYAGRYRDVMGAQPSGGHRLLARLAAEKAGAGEQLTVVTQNVDGLHGRAGSAGVLEVHGNLTDARCEACGHLQPLPPPDSFVPPPTCERCGGRGRPNVVWFGEMLPEGVLEAAGAAFRAAQVALVVGTSAQVYPAAGLPDLTRRRGGVVIEINPEETELTARADLSLRMTASEGLRRLMDGV